MQGFKQFFTESSVLLMPHDNIDSRIVQLYITGNKVKEIEEHTGKWRSYIYNVLKKEGILPHRLNQQRELTIQLANSGVSVRKIAEITSQTERNVREVINKHSRNQSHVYTEKL